MRRWHLFVLGAAAIGMVSLAAATLLRKPAAPPVLVPRAAIESATPKGLGGMLQVEPPRALPELEFRDAGGARHTLREFVGRAVLLNLWATWCGPCVAELPALAALSAQSDRAGLVVLPLSVDRGGTEQVRAFFASHGIDGLPVWNDPEGAANKALGLRGIPTTLLLDQQGREVARLEGAADWGAEGVVEELRRRTR